MTQSGIGDQGSGTIEGLVVESDDPDYLSSFPDP